MRYTLCYKVLCTSRAPYFQLFSTVICTLSPGPPVIPHFSQPRLADRHARVEHLTYLHYLSRGQPSFAFANFMAAKLLGRSNTTKRLEGGGSVVYSCFVCGCSGSGSERQCNTEWHVHLVRQLKETVYTWSSVYSSSTFFIYCKRPPYIPRENSVILCPG